MLNIKQRQMNLKYLGFYSKEIDGIEGKGTKQAYKEFQKVYGLVVDGKYGPKTDTKLIDVIKAEQARLGVKVDGVAGEITTKARDNQLTWDNIKHFKKEEFTCKCGCGMNNIDLKLVKILDEIRECFGQAVIVSSGCRCKNHNAKVGGVQGSRHVLGKAADIIVRNVSKDKVLAKCKEYVASGRARYTYTNDKNMNKAVHIDIE